jgi:hypothetical protein
MPGEETDKVPAHRVPFRWCQMHTPQSVLDGRGGLMESRADMPVIGDRDPTAACHDGYPIPVLAGHKFSDRKVSAYHDIIAETHESKPNAGQVFVDEEPDRIQLRKTLPAHAIRA